MTSLYPFFWGIKNPPFQGKTGSESTHEHPIGKPASMAYCLQHRNPGRVRGRFRTKIPRGDLPAVDAAGMGRGAAAFVRRRKIRPADHDRLCAARRAGG
jgi:hypothetical protein